MTEQCEMQKRLKRARPWGALVAALALVFGGLSVAPAAAASTVKVSGTIAVQGKINLVRSWDVCAVSTVDEGQVCTSVKVSAAKTSWSLSVPEGGYRFQLRGYYHDVDQWAGGGSGVKYQIGSGGKTGVNFQVKLTGQTLKVVPKHLGALPDETIYVSIYRDGKFYRDTAPVAAGKSVVFDSMAPGEYTVRACFWNTCLTASNEVIVKSGVTMTTARVTIPGFGSLVGKVIDKNGKPVGGVVVRVVEPELGFAENIETSTDGSFGHVNLFQGNYKFKIGGKWAWLKEGSVTLSPTRPHVTGLKLIYGYNPVAFKDPVISDTKPAVGQTVKAKVSGVTSGASLSYRWYADGKAISGATGAKFTVKSAQLGKKLTVKVTGKKSGRDTRSETSKATAKVARALKATPKPKISGTAQVGKKLTAKAGTFKPAGGKVTYQWYRGDSPIKGATKSKYKLKAADKGKAIKVKTTYKLTGYKTVTKTSATTKKTAAGVLTTKPKPTISGTRKVGKTLTAKNVAYKPTGGKVTYQWYRGSSKIKGATKSKYKLVKADKGKAIKAKTTYKLAGYKTSSVTSKATAKIK